MSTLIRIKNLSRRRLRFGGQNGNLPVSLPAASPTGTGATALVDIDDPQTRRDLYRNLGSWSHAGDQLVARVAFTGGTDTAGGIFAWANPEGQTILVDRVVLDVTTVATAANTVDVGVAANATTDATTFVSAQDTHSATVTHTSSAVAKVTSTQYITGSTTPTTGGASAGLVGVAYIYYTIANSSF